MVITELSVGNHTDLNATRNIQSRYIASLSDKKLTRPVMWDIGEYGRVPVTVPIVWY